MDRTKPNQKPKPTYIVMPLIVGGDPLDPIEAFKWERSKIIEWLKDVVERATPKSPKSPNTQPSGDGTHKTPVVEVPDTADPPLQAKQLETPMVEKITKMELFTSLLMSPGALYKGEKTGWGPAHHFSRKLHGTTPKRFEVYGATWEGVQYRNLYDVLGAFLMVVGIVQPTANKANFFAPLTAMYAKWCSKLGGHPDRETPTANAPERPGEWPTVYQCTWLSKDVTPKSEYKFQFCLGASFGGCDFDNKVPGVGWEWGERLRDRRLDRLREAGAFPPKQLPDPAKIANSRWGNCAEAYPFVIMFREATRWEDINGLALNREFFPTCDAYDVSKVKGCLWGPCGNCRYMLGYFWHVDYYKDNSRWAPQRGM